MAGPRGGQIHGRRSTRRVRADGAVVGEVVELGVSVGGHAHDELEVRLVVADPEAGVVGWWVVVTIAGGHVERDEAWRLREVSHHRPTPSDEKEESPLQPQPQPQGKQRSPSKGGSTATAAESRRRR